MSKAAGVARFDYNRAPGEWQRQYDLSGDLNVKGMLKNHCLARAIADMGFHEFRRQRTYKTARRGGTLIVADRWYASSKLCSNCAYKLASLDLGLRQWVCPACDVHHDRDVNAAINLRDLAVRSTVIACGGTGADFACKRQLKLVSAKQESNGKKA